MKQRILKLSASLVMVAMAGSAQTPIETSFGNFNSRWIASMKSVGAMLPPQYHPQVDVIIADPAPPAAYLVSVTWLDAAGDSHTTARAVLSEGATLQTVVFDVDAASIVSAQVGALNLTSAMASIRQR